MGFFKIRWSYITFKGNCHVAVEVQSSKDCIFMTLRLIVLLTVNLGKTFIKDTFKCGVVS